MTGSGKIKLTFFMILPILVGLSLFSGVLALEARANALAADPLAASDLFTLPGITAPGAGNGAGMSPSALTGTIHYFPILQKAFPSACGDSYGDIREDTIWTAVEGPYQVDCNLSVYPGVTLTIEAGTTVLFSLSDDPYSMRIEGTLLVEGTEQAPVHFIPVSGTTPGSWEGLTFSYGSSGVLDHTILEYGGNDIYNLPIGIVSIYSSAVQISNSVVKGSGDIGIYIEGASPVINATHILSNSGANGGGVVINNGSPIIQNNIVAGNSSANGGGLSILSGDPLIINNIIYDNSAENGGGLYIGYGSAIIRSNIVVSNTASSGGGVFYAAGNPRLDYNDVWNNTGGNYQGLTPAGHDISTDPLLVDLANGDLHLTPGSACIDAGDPGHHPTADLEGDPRPMGLAPDIFTDEFRTLGVEKASTSQDVYPGGPVTYSINVINNTSITLTNVQLTDSLPLETAFTGYHADDFTCTHDGAAWSGLLSCTLDSASLASGESRALTMTVVLTESLSWHQYVTNTVSLTAGVGEDTLAAQDIAPTWINWCRVQLNDTPMGDDLQVAINASTHITDVVKVSGYCPQHDLNLNKTLTLQGGWKWDFSEQNAGVYTTTLDAQKLGGVIQVQGDITPTIDGFVITGGFGDNGSGIYISLGSPTIRNNIFTKNLAWYRGSGLSNEYGSPLIQDNIFIGNIFVGMRNDYGNPIIQNNSFYGNSGPGLSSGSGSPTIQNNTFNSNGDSGLAIGSGSPLIQNNTFTGNTLRGLDIYSGNPIIQNNTFNGNSGAGLDNLYGSPLIQYNTFIGNDGGGLTNSYGNPTVQNNTFTGNHGAGMFNLDGSPILQFNLFTGNNGGGFYSFLGTPVIQNNIFMGNSSVHGGGLYSWNGTPLIQNNIFIGNTAEIGGGIYNELNTAIIRNNILVNNVASAGGGIYIVEGSYPPVLDYNDVWNNTGGDYYGVAPGAHDISADPLLVDPANGDFHLSSGSPCIDAGDPVNYPPTDFEGDARPNGAAPDIGADEYYP
jgi:uncharacterized repeat protein (TIGR01451 family)